VSGYEFRRRPIFAAGFRGRAICMALSRSGSLMSSFGKTAARLPFRLCPHATDSALGAVPYDVAAQE